MNINDEPMTIRSAFDGEVVHPACVRVHCEECGKSGWAIDDAAEACVREHGDILCDDCIV